MSESIHPFEAEVGRVLDIVINSLYKDKDIFLRELISNASDACDKLRYGSLAAPELLGDDPELSIMITSEPDQAVLTVADNGIGMNHDDLVDNLGTIARSGTARFAEQLSGNADHDLKLIGQFGVGFYSVFMVADKVVVRTRKAGEDKTWLWASDGRTGYTLSESEDARGRGTSVILHLKQDARDLLDDWKLSGIVRKYSDHIALPIILDAKPKAGDTKSNRNEPRQVNTGSALWTRPKSDISDEQYKEFYHHVSHGFDEPFARVHFSLEGTLSYTSLLFVPTQKPFDLYDPKRRHGVKLYVRRVFITDTLEELMPRYLRFVSGVIDSEDLTLNVSRETLQHGPVVARMRKAVTKRVIEELARKAKPGGDTSASAEEGAAPAGDDKTDEALAQPSYETWWQEFGAVLKEGLYEDADNRPALVELARFRSTASEGWVSLEEYVGRMKEGQDAILYISGENADALRRSPQLEEAGAKDVEVLLLEDAVDEFWLPEVQSYRNKPFKSLTRGDVDLSRIKATDGKIETPDELYDDGIKRLVAKLKTSLEAEVGDVRLSKRLRDSAVCLIAEEGGLDMRMERFLKQHGQVSALGKRVLEVNGKHELIKRMAALAAAEENAMTLDELAKLLLDQARIIEGEPIPDPGAFSRRMSTFLAKGLQEAN